MYEYVCMCVWERKREKVEREGDASVHECIHNEGHNRGPVSVLSLECVWFCLSLDAFEHIQHEHNEKRWDLVCVSSESPGFAGNSGLRADSCLLLHYHLTI